jgi:multiple sugar transport system permease protein
VGAERIVKPVRQNPLTSTKFQQRLFIWGGLTPILLYFLVFSLVPIAGAIYISLHDWPLLGGERKFIGLDNYESIIHEERFWNAMEKTALFAVCYVSLVLVIGLGLALLLLSMQSRVRFFMRPLYFAPQVTSVVAVAIMSAWLFQPQIGVVNSMLKELGYDKRLLWLNSTSLVMPTIIGTAVWRSVGYSMVIFTAGLMNIPPDLYEAALVDGASKWKAFWRITLPLLKPTTLFVFVTSTISGFQVFVEPWLMSGGGPGTASRVVMLEIYDRGFRFFQMGNASAMAVYLFLVIAAVSYLQIRYMRQTFEF